MGDIQAFAGDLSGLSDASRARLLSSVKSLLTYGHRIGSLPFNVGAPIHLPRVKDTNAERILPEEAAERAGVDLMVSPHWRRHCHDSHALDGGAAVHLVQAALGHASVPYI